MGSSNHPRKRKALFHLPPGTALDLFWQSSGQVPAPFRRRKDSPVFTHRVGAQGGNPEVLGTGGPMEERQGLGHRLCHTTGIYPTGLRGPCPSWTLFSVWLWMALTFRLGSYETHWSPLFELQALRHGNENVTVAVLQENFCLSLNESTEALNLQRRLINKGAALYM